MRLFGTDGVRGLANGETLTASLALDLAVSAAQVLASAGQFEGHRPKAVIGRDPRISGQFLEAAVASGLASAGVDVLDLGVVPTPAIAYLTGFLKADLGVVITASHNPMPDNGIKFLAEGGVKLDDALEDAIEARLGQPWTHPTGADVGRIGFYHGGIDDYVDHLVATLPATLEGLTIVLDCAHGAAHESAPLAFERAGATVIPINDQPDGLNINDGVGSTHLDSLCKAVVEHGADAGFAFDGDADRCLAVDATGQCVDGDQIMGMLALAMQASGRLVEDTLVATVMSNIGLHQAMKAAGITLRTTAVGDRYVLEDMKAGGYSLGGEQSGHVIMSEHATTGDGTLTALHVAAWMGATGSGLAELAAVVTRSPQVLINVPGVDKNRCDDEQLLAAVRHAEEILGDSGRVLLRPSGTEPLVRVMVEGPTEAQATELAERLAGIVKERLAL
ncbi:phosphoglucosamine mutase [Nocardioides sp. Kera G14]|uniref:phosphoglucosamine mutase n=1 Tax=Nocardioides sp. Kera G14 TaxID=2884264 RepID=UPI001D10D731|nr:phosphoglucosamine mutase [Nocardioides sp. Kera G14]UDY24296.1 phosphoglucosamine mutase [Nocardioides sp. Kera G14]